MTVPRTGRGSIIISRRVSRTRHRHVLRPSAMLTALGDAGLTRFAGMTVLPSRSEACVQPAQGPTAAMIEVDHVSQVFQTSARQDHLALSDISLTIEDGAFVSILGPSGCGKSTLLYIVGGFVSPTEGVARVKGKAIRGPGPDRGPVFQEFALFPWKSVLGNVMYGPRQ